MKTVAVIDGMGSGIGVQLIERIRREKLGGIALIALGTNAVAAQRMIEAGAERGASGENAIRVSVQEVDFILGPLGIILPDSMMGEVSRAMTEAILASRAQRILLPLKQSHVLIAGLETKSLGELVDSAVLLLKSRLLAGDGE